MTRDELIKKLKEFESGKLEVLIQVPRVIKDINYEIDYVDVTNDGSSILIITGSPKQEIE